jgi:hypothetical protein
MFPVQFRSLHERKIDEARRWGVFWDPVFSYFPESRSAFERKRGWHDYTCYEEGIINE